MNVGAIIEKGPQDWQIIQQENGYGVISLSGYWNTNEKVTEPRVYARIVKEETGESIVTWTPCEKLGDNGWKITFERIPAGGLYRVETCLNHAGTNGAIEWAIRGDMIHHIGIGDLYVIAGQSNSAGYGKDPIYDPPELGVHLLRNSGRWDMASHPMNESTNTIHPVNREHGNPGHSPYLIFGKFLKKELGYPIGLLQTSLGGSPLRLWNPDENGALFCNMRDIINSQGGKVKGILWYQGCSDTQKGLCDTYLERFENMVSHIRSDLAQPDLPFLTVQLNRYLVKASGEENKYWGKVREAQRQAANIIPWVFVVPALDCGLSDSIHNRSSSNLVIGERLARTALSEIYGKNYLWKGPNLVKATFIEKDSIMLEFEGVIGRLDCLGVDAPDLPFSVEDETGILSPVKYTMEANKIILSFNREISGTAFVHGAYEKNPKYIIPIDVETHLPILSFYGVKVEK